MKKHSIVVLSTIFISTIVLQSCSQPFFSQLYYLQQSVEEEMGDPFGDGGGDEGEGEEEVPPGYTSIFSVILPDGALHMEAFEENPEVLASLQEKLPEAFPFTSAGLSEKVLRSSFTADNVPLLWFDQDSAPDWTIGNSTREEYTNNGPDTKAGSNKISHVVYYQYRGLNPFYLPDGGYNTQKFSEKDETKMDRFLFYRFTGKTLSPSLDNMLVAVDTYTRLFFSFGKPIEYKSVLGQKVPTKWDAVDRVCTDSSGKKHNFYEYDPAGYVNAAGEFIREDWYNARLASGDYDPLYSGKSPYTVKIGNEALIAPEITVSTLEEEGLLKDIDTGRFYTEIRIKVQDIDLSYKLFRLDDRSSEWIETDGPISVSAGEPYTVRDYDAFMLTSLSQYKVQAVTVHNELIAESPPVQGSRMLNNREALFSVLESIRLSFTELWYTNGSAGGNLKKGSFNGEQGIYYHGIDRNGFFGTNYRRYQHYDDFKNTLFVLNGTFMKDNGGGAAGIDKQGLWTGLGSHWPDDGDFLPRRDFLEAEFGSLTFEIHFNNILINNNKGNEPEWTSGSFVVTSDFGTDEYGSSSEIPFPLFMDKSKFIQKIGVELYRQ